MDDENIERFFKNADENRFRADYDDDDWAKMERMLDEEEDRLAGVQRRFLLYKIAAGVLLIAISLSAYFFVKENHYDVRELSGDLSKSNPMESHEEKSTDQNPSTVIQEEDEVVLQKKNSNSNFESEQTGELSIDSKESNGSKSTVVKKNTETFYRDEATNIDHKTVKTDKNKTEDVGDTSIHNPVESHSMNEETMEVQSDPSAVGVIEEKSSPAIDSINVEPEKETEKREDIDTVLQGDDNSLISSRWMFSVAMAPDYSRTTSGSYDSPGDSYGLFVHYQFAKRWSVSTGFLRTEKKYEGSGDDYHPPTGYWNRVTNGVVPESVEGNCLVWEVPITFGFNVVETRRSRVFATAGISTYFMRNEDYDYTFEDSNPGSASGWSTDTPSTHWFGIGGLSVGYDYRVSPALSFGVEPYYKIPFAEVGWANIDLYSMGVLFNVRYRLIKKEPFHPRQDALK